LPLLYDLVTFSATKPEGADMKSLKKLAIATSLLTFAAVSPAAADAAKPGQSMTHMKTAAGLSALLESAGVVLYVQGGATSSVMGDSIASANGQHIFHIPVTGTKSGVQHLGSNIVFFNTAKNKQVQLKNPVIDLATGQISAVVVQAENKSMPILTITNASVLKAETTNDRKAGSKANAYKSAALALAPGIGAALTSLLGLPDGSLPEGAGFGSADVTLYSKIAKKK
jgi:hypothetical protein